MNFIVECNGKKGIKQQRLLDNSLADTLRIKIDALGKQSARTSVLTDDTKDFLLIRSKDSSIIYLQEQVKKYRKELKGGSVTVVSTSTNINATNPTIVIHDTTKVFGESIPDIYKSKLKNQWYSGSITARQDSTTLKISIENKYSVVIGEEGKFWEKKRPFVEVTNENPYTKTNQLRAFVTSKPKEKKWGIGVIGGYGVGSKGLTPIVGIGIQYIIFKF